VLPTLPEPGAGGHTQARAASGVQLPLLREETTSEVQEPQRSAQGRIWAGLYYSTGRVTMATKGTASACCLSGQELHRSIGMIHSLHMSRVLTDFNPSLGKQEQRLCQGTFHTDTKGLPVGWGRLGQAPGPAPAVGRGTRAAPSPTAVSCMIYRRRPDTRKLATTVSAQDNH